MTPKLASWLLLLMLGAVSPTFGASYYVNDSVTNGDVYCSTNGSDAFSGLSNSAPKLTITNLLAAYTLLQGDIVYIDTGVYSNYTVTIDDSGVSTNYIAIQGSSNYVQGGTIIARNSGASDGVVLSGANFIRLQDLVVRSARYGIFAAASANVEYERITCVSNVSAFNGASAVGHRFKRCTAAFCGIGFDNFNSACTWDGGVMYSNTVAFAPAVAATVSISNSVIEGGTAFSTVPAAADFNCYWNTVLASDVANVSELQLLSGHSSRSTFDDPGFANGPGLDFHPRSVVGRVNQLTGLLVTDAVHSVLIDLGDPVRIATNELPPNGSRLDVGVFGDHREASRSRTNPWLYAVSFNDGGNLVTTGTLHWTFGGFTNLATTLLLEYSPDGGNSWTSIVTGVPVTNGSYMWNATGAVGSLNARWRVMDTNSLVVDANNTNFVIRPNANVGFTLYVNDGVTNGDMYTFSPGNVTNSGLTAFQPRHSIQSILDTFDVGAGDTILVDVGLYSNGFTVVSNDQGAQSNLLTIAGSTNPVQGRTIIDIANLGLNVATLSGANYVRFRDLVVRKGARGVFIVASSGCEFERVYSVSNGVGFSGSSALDHRFIRCVASHCGTAFENFNTGITWDQGIMWSNTTAFAPSSAGTVSISNSFIVGGTAFGVFAPFDVDYNAFWNTAIGAGFISLYDYQKVRTNAWNNTFADPQFNNPSGLDFHELSAFGRYSLATGLVVSDGVTSVAIDLGDPARVFTNEVTPNGFRMNLGPFGNTVQASRSSTGTVLYALSFQDGGQLSVPGAPIYWTSVNAPSGSTVRIEYSGDGGFSWNFVVTNLSAASGTYVWNNTNFPSSRFSRWRVVYESNTNVIGATGTNFIFRNGPFNYFVNDSNTANDVYTSAIGNDGNLGTSSNSPKYTLASVFASHDIDPGDLIYLDTGVYEYNTTPVLASADSGDSTNYVVLIGSTNRVVGGSVINQNGGSSHYGLHLNGAPYVEIRDVVFTNGGAGAGLRVENSAGIRITRVTARDVGLGIHVRISDNVVIDRSVLSSCSTNGIWLESGTGLVVNASIAWRNGVAGLRVDAGNVRISNSVVAALSPYASAYSAATTTNIFGNFNDLYAENGAAIATFLGSDEVVDTLSGWRGRTGQETFSLSTDPLFANPASGDFHLKTQTVNGRYDPVLGVQVSDAETSPLIDAGAPTSAYSNEPPFNGNRVNIDRFGNTTEASVGRSTPWLFAANLRQGGWVSGTATLNWVAGAVTNGTTVDVEFSADGGINFVTLTNGVPATNELYTWNTTSTSNTPAGLWRVRSTSDPLVKDQTTNFFSLRNGALTVYVNNEGSTTGDVFTTGSGAATNWVATQAKPFNSLAEAFRLFDFEPGDQVFLDTGVYTGQAALVSFGYGDAGRTGNPVRVAGSTNEAAGGAILDPATPVAPSFPLFFDRTRNLEVSNVTVRGAHTGVVVSNSINVTLSVIASANFSNGFEVGRATNVTLTRSGAAQNGGRGVAVRESGLVRVLDSVIWSNMAGGLRVLNGSVVVSNSVLSATGVGRYLFETENLSDSIRSDYNDLVIGDQAQVALTAGKAFKFVSSWQGGLTNDIHSLTHDPLFANPSALDFHLKSAAGRYQPGAGVVTDVVTSLLIDSGHPSASFAMEPVPNGGRRNVGRHGDSAEASRSRTNGWLLALTYNDGGNARGTNGLYWVAGGNATGSLVYIDYSMDDGLTWTNIATNVLASAGVFPAWDSTPNGSSPLSAWRLVSQSDSNVWDRTDAIFTLNNGSVTYYVNDSTTNGDIYCTNAGNPVFDGLSASTPKISIKDILDAYILQPGDRILVDTGTYSVNSTIQLDYNVGGSQTNFIQIVGSTNIGAGGTVLDRLSGATLFDVIGTGHLLLSDFQIINAEKGVRFFESTNCVVERVSVRGSPNYQQNHTGFELLNSTGVTFRACQVYGITNAASSALRISGSLGILLQSSVMWSNRIAVEVNGGSIIVSNTSFGVFGAETFAYQAGLNTVLSGNYNNFYHADGGRVASISMPIFAGLLIAPTYYDTLSSWNAGTGNDRFSLSHEPAYAAPGSGDFHLRSSAGRYAPGTGTVFDTDYSLLLDAGNPDDVFTNEPAPNGGRIEIGRYGNTSEASQSPSTGQFVAVTFNDGGVASGTSQLLYWLATGSATGEPIMLSYSPDNTATWLPIVSNLPAGTRTHVWNTVSYPSSQFGRWRVESTTNSLLADTNDARFVVHNSNFVFYVNDGSTTGDVYCTNAGLPSNSGLSTSSPMDSVQLVLETYDVEPGDRILVDTGIYSPTNRIRVEQSDGGAGTNIVEILGSTNLSAGGTLLLGQGVFLDTVKNVVLRDLRVTMSPLARRTGLQINASTNVFAENLWVTGAGDGFTVRQSVGTHFSRCTASGSSTNGLFDDGSRQSIWNSGILWSNTLGAFVTGSGLEFSNSIIAAFGSGQLGLRVTGAFTSDYNGIYVQGGALVAQEFVIGRTLPLDYDSVSRWARGTGRDQHSLSQNPGFAAPSTDFHLNSTAGRFDATYTNIVVDGVNSPLLDAASPASSFTNEPPPNGGRRNIGHFGDTGQASLSSTNPALTAVSLNDGGIASGTSQLLYWVATGAATGMTVRLDFSPDNGGSWALIASGVPATPGAYYWNTTNNLSTPLALWRVVLESNTNVFDISDSIFALRNGSILFYVNDSSTTGDVYSSSVGSSTNTGISSNQPLDKVSAVLSTYDLEPGDTIYVDTGIYADTATLTVGQLDSALSFTGSYVTIQGSTNYAKGGTVLNRLNAAGAVGINCFDAEGMRFRDLTIRGAETGVRFDKSPNALLERVHVVGALDGFAVISSSGTRFNRCVARNGTRSGLALSSSAGLVWESGILWSNAIYAVDISSSQLSVSNSIFGALAGSAIVYNFNEQTTLTSEYNDFFLTNGASMAAQTFPAPAPQSMAYQNVARWARDTGRDRFSLSHDPLFVNAATGDFHLLSQGGRYDVASEVFTNDLVSSPLIDAGSPFAAFTNESAPNGGRLNMGLFGNTVDASRTATNGVLVAASLNDGGRADGNGYPLYWTAQGAVTADTVRLEISTNSGVSFVIVASNLAARPLSAFLWNTTAHSSTIFSVWRIVAENTPGVTDRNDNLFAIRNQPISFFVNDASTNGDVYSTSVGDSMKDGGSPSQPLDRLQSVLDNYDLEPGDTIFVDTGSYTLSQEGVLINRFDAWDLMTNTAPLASGTRSLTIRGSTNDAAGGSEIIPFQFAASMTISGALGMVINDIKVNKSSGGLGAGVGFEILKSHYSDFRFARADNHRIGFHVDDSDFITFQSCVASKNAESGLSTLNSDQTTWNNGILWSNTQYGLIQNDNPGVLRVKNTVLGAFGAGSFGIVQIKGTLVSDYNDIYRASGGFVAGLIQGGSLGGGTSRYETATAWAQASGNDIHSLSAPPDFASAGLDFHLQSPYGRYLPGTGFITNGADSLSRLIDAGDPASAYSAESQPNGSRIDIGIYGNTPEASHSTPPYFDPPTNLIPGGALSMITFNDGGSGQGVLDLRWSVSGTITGCTVQLDFSSNGGLNWTNIVSGQSAASELYVWNSIGYGSAAAGKLRVIAECNTNIYDVTDMLFALRNSNSIPYYVNDTGTANDVYCSVAGNDSFDGFLPSTPKRTVQALIDAIDLEPGDIVYVDTGTYGLNADVKVGDLDAGLATSRVVFVGSTNIAAGGTVLDRTTGSGVAVSLFETANVELRNMRLKRGNNGISLFKSDNCVLSGIISENNTAAGCILELSTNALFEYCTIIQNSNGISSVQSQYLFKHGVLWANQNPVLVGGGSDVGFNHSVLQAVGNAARIYKVETGGGAVTADYNDYVRQSGALVYERPQLTGGNEIYTTLVSWRAAYGQDEHTLSHEPAFANDVSGDFHPRSANGRFLISGIITNDPPGVFSPLLDTGDPLAAFTNETPETPPYGGRVDIGLYGNTKQASRSQTNAWLLAVSINDGGKVKGTNVIHWVAGGMSNGSLVNIEFAADGVDYVPVVTNLLASSETYTWDMSAIPVTSHARWRVVSVSDPLVLDAVDNEFTIKNQTLVIYVNDDSQDDDAFCFDIGNVTNTGFSPLAPLADPIDALRRYSFGEDDYLYIDTGNYQLTNADGLAVGLVDGDLEIGLTNEPIRIIGTTNIDAQTVLVGFNSVGTNVSYGLRILSTRHVEVSNLRITGADYGVEVALSEQVVLNNVQAYSNSLDGFLLNGVKPVQANRCAAWNNGGFGFNVGGAQPNVILDSGLIWSNAGGGVSVGGGASFSASNSFLNCANTNKYIVFLNPGASYVGDHNFLVASNGAFLGFDAFVQLPLLTLKSLQARTGADSRSGRLDPLFANATLGDFHVRSTAGRYDPIGQAFVTSDTETSWAIDAGAVGSLFANEPSPNGGRRNIGLFGDTLQASKSLINVSNKAIQVLTLDDGGTVKTTQQYLYWLARGLSASELLTIEYSPNSGVDWLTVATNINPLQDGYLWNTAAFTSSPSAYWRISSQTNFALHSTNQTTFALRLTPITFYVNDASTVLDMYSDVVGNDSFDGLRPTTPVRNIERIFERYDLEGGDKILVDAGTYVTMEGVVIRSDDSGQAFTNPVAIIGSTNFTAAPTIIDRASTNKLAVGTNDTAFALTQADFISMSHLILKEADIGISLDRSSGGSYSNVHIRDSGTAGILVGGGSGENRIDRCVIDGGLRDALSINGGGATVSHSVIWTNDGSAVAMSGGTLVISNSVLHAAITNYIYKLTAGSSVVGDYNDLTVVGNAKYAIIGDLELEGIPQWTRVTTQDLHSVSSDPLFAGAATHDYHVRSKTGRFDPPSSLFITVDTNFSYLIDVGPTNEPFANELPPNGSRRNIGLHGGTAQASKSQTNDWLLAITASAGGRAQDTFFLIWAWGGMNATNRVKLDYSFDDGTNWINIVSNQSVNSGQYLWNSLLTPFSVSPIARWRIVRQDNTNVYDISDRSFGLNGPFTFYVNDTSTVNDVFTIAVGNDINLGISSNLPKGSLYSVFTTWDMEGGDRVLVDTGSYNIDTNLQVVIGLSDQGRAGLPVLIRGSSNGVLNVWAEPTPGGELLQINGSFIVVTNLAFSKGSVIASGTNNVFALVTVTNGLLRVAGSSNVIDHARLVESSHELLGAFSEVRDSLFKNSPVSIQGRSQTLRNSVLPGTQTFLVAISGTNIALRNNTIVSAKTAVKISGVDSTAILRDNILIATGFPGEDNFVIQRDGGQVDSDYNDLIARNGAWVGNANGYWERLLYWQRESGQDAHSFAAEPLFVNEAGDDLHVKSLTGHYTSGGFVSDGTHSPVIDAGDPTSDFANEPNFNGGRVNMGAYGNTLEASKSRTDPWVQALSMNDGGVLKGTNATLRWLFGNINSTNRFTLQYSSNGGLTWTNFAANLPATGNQYTWNTTTVTSSLTAAWRVLLESDTNVVDQTDALFAVRNTPLNFYVNDASMLNDVFTSTNGAPGNNGLFTNTPLHSVIGVLTNYDMEAGDAIYVDTGSYSHTSDVLVIWSDGGDDDGNLLIRGSTNFAAGGSVISRGNTTIGHEGFLVRGSHVALRDLTVKNAYRGLYFLSNKFYTVERMLLVSNTYGMVLDGTISATGRNLRVLYNTQGGVDVINTLTSVVENSTFVDNVPFAIRVQGTVNTNTFQNNIFYFDVGFSNTIVALDGNTTLNNSLIDYNIYYFGPLATNAGIALNFPSLNIFSLIDWQRFRQRDYRSAVTNPLFADLSSGDLHVRSVAGRYVDGVGFVVADTQTSFAVDHGNPMSYFSNEPAVHGGRINIGAYGGTEYASKGNTNSYFDVRTADDQLNLGPVQNPWPLIWDAHLIPDGTTVRLEYSGDYGSTWIAIATNLPALQEFYVWTLSPLYNTYNRGRWRVVGEQSPFYSDINNGRIDTFFGQFQISDVGLQGSTNSSIIWRGAWGEHYQVQYASKLLVGQASLNWSNAVQGSATNQKANFLSTIGGDFYYQDVSSGSTGPVLRLYRVILEQVE